MSNSPNPPTSPVINTRSQLLGQEKKERKEQIREEIEKIELQLELKDIRKRKKKLEEELAQTTKELSQKSPPAKKKKKKRSVWITNVNLKTPGNACKQTKLNDEDKEDTTQKNITSSSKSACVAKEYFENVEEIVRVYGPADFDDKSSINQDNTSQEKKTTTAFDSFVGPLINYKSDTDPVAADEALLDSGHF